MFCFVGDDCCWVLYFDGYVDGWVLSMECLVKFFGYLCCLNLVVFFINWLGYVGCG